VKSVFLVGVGLQRFVARVPGLASGLALAVRPAGSAESPGLTARACLTGYARKLKLPT